MKKTKVIIGSNFGDEGKGRMVDYFASQKENGIVVRFNGGCQAAHTVHEPITNEFHQFGHFGSGTILNYPTYLSEYFLVNPLVLFSEIKEYKTKFSNDPKIIIHPECLLTTPWDMLINQEYENYLNENRHGTCGLGINETVERSKIHPLKIEDIQNKNFEYKVKYIIDLWVIERCRKLGIKVPKIANNHFIYLNFINDCFKLKNTFKIAYTDYLRKFNNIIFEGAQGLLLDQNHSFFPHVTRSNTGIQNVIPIAKKSKIQNLEIIYVTRCYLTRHGAGPLPFESKEKIFKCINDDNQENEFQGHLRFAPLNLDLLFSQIKKDFDKDTDDINKHLSIAITCLDQIKNEDIPVVINNELIKLKSKSELISLIQTIPCKINRIYLGSGKTRNETDVLK